MLGTLIFVTILSCYLFKENLYNFLKGISALFRKKCLFIFSYMNLIKKWRNIYIKKLNLFLIL